MSVEGLREAVGKLIADRASSSDSKEVQELRTALENVNKDVDDITNTINSVLNPSEPFAPVGETGIVATDIPDEVKVPS